MFLRFFVPCGSLMFASGLCLGCASSLEDHYTPMVEGVHLLYEKAIYNVEMDDQCTLWDYYEAEYRVNGTDFDTDKEGSGFGAISELEVLDGLIEVQTDTYIYSSDSQTHYAYFLVDEEGWLQRAGFQSQEYWGDGYYEKYAGVYEPPLMYYPPAPLWEVGYSFEDVSELQQESSVHRKVSEYVGGFWVEYTETGSGSEDFDVDRSFEIIDEREITTPTGTYDTLCVGHPDLYHCYARGVGIVAGYSDCGLTMELVEEL